MVGVGVVGGHERRGGGEGGRRGLVLWGALEMGHLPASLGLWQEKVWLPLCAKAKVRDEEGEGGGLQCITRSSAFAGCDTEKSAALP
jgi:hypothetical protein